MISTIFFDFDGVLTTDKSGSYTTCTNLQKHIPHIEFDHILRCYRKHHQALLVGEIDHKVMWPDFCACVGEQMEMDVLNQAFRDTPKNEDIFHLCEALKVNYQLGIITDNSKDRFATVKDAMQLTELFTYIIVSGETGFRKKEPNNFRLALAMTNAVATECIFIDNSPANLIAPDKLGFKTIFFDDERNDIVELVRVLQEFGIDIAM